jgi:hypothetical protein
MTFNVHELRRAKWDKRHIFEWLFERSPRGATASLDAYDQMIERLRAMADTLPLAHESREFDLEVKQILFKTKRGRIYRAVFHLAGADVYILRVRGPGQAPVGPDELAP